MMSLQRRPRQTFLLFAVLVFAAATIQTAGTASAQIIAPVSSSTNDSTAKLKDRLVNRLRATTEPQQKYIEAITKLVAQNKLELRLVVAVERYAVRRNPHYPFPFFERALQFEARKRNVVLPSIQHFQNLSQLPPAG